MLELFCLRSKETNSVYVYHLWHISLEKKLCDHGGMEMRTVETTSFATPTLDSPPLISMYYLPYKNGEVKKFVLY